MNLISNAIKFTPKEGRVLVKLTLRETPGSPKSEFIDVSVEDNGCGIKETDKDQLFKLFGTIDKTRDRINLKGIGLGLVISKLLVERFDGELTFESEEGKGSDFQFSFKLEKIDALDKVEAPKEDMSDSSSDAGQEAEPTIVDNVR